MKDLNVSNPVMLLWSSRGTGREWERGRRAPGWSLRCSVIAGAAVLSMGVPVRLEKPDAPSVYT